ncbi:hypothetical protein EYF80_053474 [Liparis tanakae]|uniref:Uncharacterized protein n=1 Tax=Liparis tanakae TaxID=230148 RepID=A0A4Z2F690_9TELE|nr:hypothetical protein EYF80_053474 [Liparis tanakae]
MWFTRLKSFVPDAHGGKTLSLFLTSKDSQDLEFTSQRTLKGKVLQTRLYRLPDSTDSTDSLIYRLPDSTDSTDSLIYRLPDSTGSTDYLIL